ncbi:MAG: methyltransferase [Candidatus Binatia bacterium]
MARFYRGETKNPVSATLNHETASKVSADETLDTLFQGGLRFFQARRGYRFSLDALLLADFATFPDGGPVADLGTGNGVVALILAYLHPSWTITGLEIQPAMVERACRNVQANGFARRVTIHAGDVRKVREAFAPATFATVVCNPPYRRPSAGRISPDGERKIARHEITAALGDFLRAGEYLLSLRGRMALIYPAVRLVDLLQSMRSADLEPKRLRMVHSFSHTSASLVLVEGVKCGRGGVEVLSPLVVYEEGKRYSAEVETLLTGKAAR